MHVSSISWQHVILALVLLAALYHFIAPLIPRSFRGHTGAQGKKAERLRNIQFCKSQHRLWKWKRKFFAPEGDHAAILLTMINLGDKNFSQFNDRPQATTQCADCGDEKPDSIELDRATRAYKSAQNIAKMCTWGWS